MTTTTAHTIDTFRINGERLWASLMELAIIGATPKAGDTLVVLPTEREAREIAERRQGLADAESKRARQHLTLEAFHHEATAGKVRALPIVLKADVQGSLEAIRESLQKLGNNEISVRVIPEPRSQSNIDEPLLFQQLSSWDIPDGAVVNGQLFVAAPGGDLWQQPVQLIEVANV